MMIVVERQRIWRIIMMLLLFVILGVLYLAARHEREARMSNPTIGVVARIPEMPVEHIDRGSAQVLVQPASAVRFDEYRMERDRVRAMQIDLLRAAAAESGISEARKTQLTTELLALLKRNEREMQAESLLRAKGFSDAVVVLADDTASVVLPEVLQQEEAGLVGELVSRVANVSLERIAIIDGAGDA
ncbi:MAG: SpoIIIAH-like family protein [Firmicutes bacterium]|nr:SpoIIIAH-like family protein [Bacillota bacterium]